MRYFLTIQEGAALKDIEVTEEEYRQAQNGEGPYGGRVFGGYETTGALPKESLAETLTMDIAARQQALRHAMRRSPNTWREDN